MNDFNKLREALDILEKGTSKDVIQCFLFAEHDIIGFGLGKEDVNLSPEETKRLDELGVCYEGEYDSYIMFV